VFCVLLLNDKLHPTAKETEDVNRKCPRRNQLYYTEPERHNAHTQRHRLTADRQTDDSIMTACMNSTIG